MLEVCGCVRDCSDVPSLYGVEVSGSSSTDHIGLWIKSLGLSSVSIKKLM